MTYLTHILTWGLCATCVPAIKHRCVINKIFCYSESIKNKNYWDKDNLFKVLTRMKFLLNNLFIPIILFNFYPKTYSQKKKKRNIIVKSLLLVLLLCLLFSSLSQKSIIFSITLFWLFFSRYSSCPQIPFSSSYLIWFIINAGFFIYLWCISIYLSISLTPWICKRCETQVY